MLPSIRLMCTKFAQLKSQTKLERRAVLCNPRLEPALLFPRVRDASGSGGQTLGSSFCPLHLHGDVAAVARCVRERAGPLPVNRVRGRMNRSLVVIGKGASIGGKPWSYEQGLGLACCLAWPRPRGALCLL